MEDQRKNWISLNRSLLLNEMWKAEPFTKGQAWVDLLLMANHTDCIPLIKGVAIPVKRGQLCRSMKQLAVRWQWSEGKVKRYLNLLSGLSQISFQNWLKNGAVDSAGKTGVTTLITVTNYNLYQKNGAVNGAQTERKQCGDGAETATVNKENKDNKEKQLQQPSVSEVSALYCRYAGVNMIGGQIVVIQDLIKAYPLELITEAFQAAAAANITGKGFMSWCKARLERKGEAVKAAEATSGEAEAAEIAFLKREGLL